MTIPETLSLAITTPMSEIANTGDVRSLRARDESGSFGIQPGHIDLLSALVPCVVQWRDGSGAMHYCAIHGGILTVANGRSIRIACREAVVGENLKQLEMEVRRHREQAAQEANRERIEQAKLHARAIRQIMLRLSADAHAMDELFS